jgi:deoxyadenosine/deoxycytidine kinase
MKFNSLLHVIFKGAYWLRFWAQLQHKEQAKDTLIAMSRKLEVVALRIANRGRNNFYRLP